MKTAFRRGLAAAILSTAFAPPASPQQVPLEAMVITPRAKVGIGTPAPLALLAVDGDRLVASGKASVHANSNEVIGDRTRFTSEVVPGNIVWFGSQRAIVVEVKNDNHLLLDRPLAKVSTTTMEVSANPFLVRSSADVAQVLITAEGRIGVGTDRPQRPLHVRGGTEPPFLVEATPNNYAMIGLKGDTAARDWQVQATNAVKNEFRIAYGQNNPVLKLDSSGHLWLLQPPTSTRADYGCALLLQPSGEVGVDSRCARGARKQQRWGRKSRQEVMSAPTAAPEPTAQLLEELERQGREIEALREENRAIRQFLCAERPEAPLCAGD